MSIVHNTSVDFTRRVISEPVHIVQGDKTLPQIEVELLADGQPYTIPSGASVAIRYRKPDGNAIVNNAASTSGNTATFTVTEQMSALPGEMSPQVMVTVSGGVAATGSFPLIIDKNSVEGAKDSESELSAFDKAIQAVETVNESVEKAALSEKNAAASEKAAKTSETNAANSAKAASASQKAAADRAQEAADKADTVAINAEAAEKAATDAAASATAANTAQDSASASASASAQSSASALQSAQLAEQYKNEAFSGTPTGYADLVAKVNSIYRQTATSYNVVGTSEGSVLAHTIYGMSVQDGTPTPSVPVEIQSAKADFRCTGKNLIPYPYYYQSGYSMQGMTGTYGDDGIITVNKVAGSATAYFGLYSGYKMLIPNTRYKLSMSLENTNNASVFISVNRRDIAAIRNKASGNYDYTFTTPNELLGTTRMAIYFGADDVETNCKIKVMLTLADADQTYEVNQHADITTDLTLRAIEVASTDDYTYERDGKYYIADTVDWSEDEGYKITRRVKEIIYNGTESWTTRTISANRHAFFRNLADNVPPKTQDDNIYAVSNRFSATSRNDFVNNTVTNVFAQNATNSDLMFVLADTSITTVAQWKTWLESNNVIVDYVLATPTTESITSEQAQALLSLKTYDEATSISATGDIEPSLDLEYSKDRNTALALTGHNLGFKNALNLNDINTALIELGGTV